jgi:hypothetical protein
LVYNTAQLLNYGLVNIRKADILEFEHAWL